MDKLTRDYTHGDLSAASYEQLLGQCAAEREAAEAERDQLRANVEEVKSSRENLDAESEMLRRLAALGAEVSSRVTTVADVEALRASWTAVFDVVHLRQRSVGFYVEPHIRREMLEINAVGTTCLSSRHVGRR